MDDAITLIEAAAGSATAPTTPHIAEPESTATVLQTGHRNTPAPVAKTTRVIRASEFTVKAYLETEADVDAYIATLKAELMIAIKAGQKARVQ